jgi:hypothetical protein
MATAFLPFQFFAMDISIHVKGIVNARTHVNQLCESKFVEMRCVALVHKPIILLINNRTPNSFPILLYRGFSALASLAFK